MKVNTDMAYPKAAERYFVIHNRQEAVKVMKTMYMKGYRWIVRDCDSEYLSLYSLKPKRYFDLNIWGYRDENALGVLMCESIKNTDIKEIRWKNRQPTDLQQFIFDNELERDN